MMKQCPFRNCGQWFDAKGRARFCPTCQPIAAREKKNETERWRMRRVRGTTHHYIRKNDAEVAKRETHYVRRTECHTASDILHAAPEIAARMIDAILAGKDVYAGGAGK